MYLFYFFAAVLVFLGYKSFRGGMEYLEYFRRELGKPVSNYLPFVSVFLPCKGVDQGLDRNISALFDQDYPHFEVIFVVDSVNDSSVSAIKKQIETLKPKFDLISSDVDRSQNIQPKIVIAGIAIDEGQKVHNLRIAVPQASDESEVFVFLDSDARPSVKWLRNLVAPLEDEAVGCTTGYRWFISTTNSFPAQLRSVWNASIASSLGQPEKNRFCWGGSTAIRRTTFENLDVCEKWRGTVSDDFALTRALKEARQPIYFVPACLTATVENCSFAELIEFTTRQMQITRVYAPNLWIASLIGSGVFTIVFWTGFALLFFLSNWEFWFVLALLFVIFSLGAAKSWIRLKAVRLVLTEFEKELSKSTFWQLGFWQLATALFFYNCLRALTSNVIRWRGIRYRLDSANKTEILDLAS